MSTWTHRWNDDIATEPELLLFQAITGGFRSRSCLDKPFAEVATAIGLKYDVSPRAMRRTFQDLSRAAA